jgi:hemoglobin-like flavoprotein
MSTITETTAHVQDTWAIVSKQPDFIDTFFQRLFLIRPDFKQTLFRESDLKEVGLKLAGQMDLVVNNLTNTSELVPTLQSLGMRHCSHGVRAEYYAPFGDALLGTVEHYLREDFTPDVKAAWVGCFQTVQTIMSSQCDTEDGRKLIAAFEAAHPAPVASVASLDGLKTGLLIGIPAVLGILFFLGRRRAHGPTRGA